MTVLYAATGNGVARVADDGSVEAMVQGGPCRCVAVGSGFAYAGSGVGVVRLEDGTALFRGDVFSVGVGPDGAVYAGTEPSALHVSRDGGGTWEELESLQDIPSRPTWSFPPRPWTSHVRWIAPSPHDPALLLAGIELGGLMRSADGGATWADHRPGAQPDVHCLAWHPSAKGHAYETGGGGAAWSRDGGETWEPADAGRDRHYTWALAVDAESPGRWWCSASTGPSAAHGGRNAEARIFRWEDGRWHALTDLLRAMPYALLHHDGVIYAGFSDGTLQASGDGGETWDDVAFLPTIVALAA